MIYNIIQYLPTMTHIPPPRTAQKMQKYNARETFLEQHNEVQVIRTYKFPAPPPRCPQTRTVGQNGPML